MEMNKKDQRIIKGNAWVFGDNINTDIIHPPAYFSLDPDKVKKGLFAHLDPNLQPRLQANDIIIGGKNFGCGSSRETSMRSLKLNKIGAIVAVSFARIFYRNATNLSLPCLEFSNPSDHELINKGDTLELDLDSYILKSSQYKFPLQPVGDFVQAIWRAGGLLNLLENLPDDVEQDGL